MKEKIYTIPVNEALDQNEECLFCTLQKKVEEDILNYVLGPSYMEEDVREEMDKMGFCSRHYKDLYQAGNRLGLALMTQTHLKKLNRDLESLYAAELANTEEKRRPFQKKTDDAPLKEYQAALSNSCYACHRMAGRMDSYVNTFLYLWRTEATFRERVLGGKGFCLEHFSHLLTEGKKQLSKSVYRSLLTALIPLQRENLKRVESDLDWFIQKFDYRFQNEPWHNSKDAVERSLLKVSGVRVHNTTEHNPKGE